MKVMCMGTPPCLAMFIFTKGNNFRDFLFASLTDIALLKWGFLLKEKFAPRGAFFFPF